MSAPAVAGRLETRPRPDDERYMRLALALGARHLGLTWPNPSVGAVVVGERDGEPIILGQAMAGRGLGSARAVHRMNAAQAGGEQIFDGGDGHGGQSARDASRFRAPDRSAIAPDRHAAP